jgi:hypothetical protein
MKQAYRLLLYTSFASVLFLVAFAGSAQAAQREITLTPTSASPVIAPGQAHTDSFQVMNNGQSGYAYSIYSSPYHVQGEDYSPRFTPVSHTIDPSKWFSFSRTSGQSNPGQVIAIDYTIHVPGTTPPGGYYATIFAQTVSPKSNSSSVELSQRVGEIIYIQVAGPVTQGGAVLSWNSSLLQSAPVIATTRLKNSGNLHYAATINVTVKDVFGNTKYTYDTTRRVLPKTVRQIPIRWDEAPIFGLFKVSGDASYLNKRTTLESKWVLVMAIPMRIAVASGTLLLITVYTVKLTLRKRESDAKKVA